MILAFFKGFLKFKAFFNPGLTSSDIKPPLDNADPPPEPRSKKDLTDCVWKRVWSEAKAWSGTNSRR